MSAVTLMTIEEIRKRLEFMNLRAVARETGIAYRGLIDIKAAKKNPSYESLVKLTTFLERN